MQLTGFIRQNNKFGDSARIVHRNSYRSLHLCPYPPLTAAASSADSCEILPY